MDFKNYLSELAMPDREAFATRCKTSYGHLRNVMYGYRQCDPELAVNVERESGATVRRWDLRPGDWHLIWPELVGVHGAPEALREEDKARTIELGA